MSEQTVKWKELTEDSQFELEDHDWYLLAIKGYGTPMKAKYHICEGFEILMQGTPKFLYVWEWKDKITHYMEMPKLPQEEGE